MKFSTTVTTAMLLAGSAASSRSTRSLRRQATNRNDGVTASNTYDARILIGGLVQEPSTEDLNVISQNAITEYNKAFLDMGLSFIDIKMQLSVGISEDGKHWWTPTSDKDFNNMENKSSESALIFVGVQWRNDNQDAAQDMHLHLKGSVGAAHQTFERSFCDKLRTSGSTNLVDAKDCAFNFLEKPGTTDHYPVETAYSSANGQATQVQVSIMGLDLHKGDRVGDDMTDADLALLGQSIMSAHDDAFTALGYTLESFQVLADMRDIPTTIASDENDVSSSSSFATATTTLIAATAVPTTPDDSDNGGHLKKMINDPSLFTTSDIQYMHDAFEKAFCTKLQNSGAPVFVNAHACSFRFVYNPMGHATSALE